MKRFGLQRYDNETTSWCFKGQTSRNAKRKSRLHSHIGTRKSRLHSRIALLFASVFVWFALWQPARAANAVESIDISIVLQDDGSARIVEVWSVHADEGTELYLPKQNLEENDMSVSDLKVTDQSGREFEILENWDVNRSFEEKAYKAGYHRVSGGVELCVGLSSYGSNTFTIAYTFHNFVARYADGFNGFNQRVVNDELMDPPDRVTVTMQKEGVAFTPEDTKIWAFGFDGTIHLVDGKIVAKTMSSLNASEHVTIMASFENEMFHPRVTQSFPFETVKERAFVGSSYVLTGQPDESIPTYPDSNWDEQSLGVGTSEPPVQGKSASDYLVRMVPLGIFVAYLGGLIAIWRKIKVKRNPQKTLNRAFLSVKSDVDQRGSYWHRELPYGGDLNQTEFALNQLYRARRMDHVIGALFLRWLQKGYISIEQEQTKAFFGLFENTTTTIGSLDANMPTDPIEQELYLMMQEAAGRDGDLQDKEFYNWSSRHYRRIYTWYARFVGAGEDALFARGDFIEEEEKTFLGLMKQKKRSLTPLGERHVEELLGFQQYLTDFTLVNERQAVEVALWDDYLVYATMYGIADRVSEEFHDLYPGYFDDRYQGGYTGYRNTTTMVYAMSYAMHNGASSGRSASSSGGGGSSSSGGGGGFSGGGSGGGIR